MNDGRTSWLVINNVVLVVRRLGSTESDETLIFYLRRIYYKMSTDNESANINEIESMLLLMKSSILQGLSLSI
jgi:hypothetical protein